MTQQADYSETEWKTLCDAPTIAGGMIIAADFGVFSFMKELRAAIKYIEQAKVEFQGTELIEAIVAAHERKASGHDDGDDDDHGESGKLPPKDQMLAKLDHAIRVVEARSPAEAATYKRFVYRTAETVANASGEGWFGTGPKVSAAEQRALDELKVTLRL